LEEEVFACMERSKQSYAEVMLMPVKKLENYLRWKVRLEDEKEKALEETLNKK